MDLTGKQKRYLRGLAHHLKPILQIGAAGVSDHVLRATSRALEDHELIKVNHLDSGPDDKKDAARKLAKGTGAVLVQVIGHTAVLYKRRDEDPEIELPKA